MSALVAYGSSDEETVDDGGAVMDTGVSSNAMAIVTVNAAPSVVPRFGAELQRCIDPTTKEIMYNPTADELFAPVIGPEDPQRKKKMTKNTFTGYVEAGEVSEHHFEDQRRTFSTLGYAHDPSVHEYTSTQNFVGDNQKAIAMGGETLSSTRKRTDKRKRKPKGDPSDVDGYLGPWAAYENEVKFAEPTEEQKAILASYKESVDAEEKAEAEEADTEGVKVKRPKVEKADERSTLHIDDPVDYQDLNIKFGEPPARCFLPKKLLHTWSGHTKAVAAIKFFPTSAHLLLSAGMDNKIKLWEVYGKRRVVRTFLGHTAACRDIDFSADGKHFLSCGYDRVIREWDTETGQCVHKYQYRKIPYCLKFHPTRDNKFVVGGQDKKILCFDTRSGNVVQTYDRHLGAVNTITFVENGRRMVTTSDDKSIRVWEWGIPVDMKYIADPKMHAISNVHLHPNGKWMLCQGQNNEITTYQSHDKFRMNPKKKFKGHLVAGYACQVGSSPDGRYVISGDSEGKCFIWDWKTCKVYDKFKAHDNVCSGVVWNPNETSKIATCGWDGLIKYWD